MATSLAEMRAQHNEPNQAARQHPKTLFDLIAGDAKFAKAVAAVANGLMTPDRFLRLAVNAVKKTPLLLECDPQSVLGALMASAALGLEPNTVQQQAFLIPFKKRVRQGDAWVDTYDCQFQIGYRGFITLAHRSPHIHSLQAEAIHERDLFEHMLGTNSFLKFSKTLQERGALLGAFAYSRLANGVEIATVLPADEIYKIRGRSETYSALERSLLQAANEKDRKAAHKKLADTPWVLWEDDMAAKSAIKKHAKQLPLMPGEALAAAVALDTDGEDRAINLATLADPDAVRAVVQEGFAPEPEAPGPDTPLAVTQQEPEVLEPQAGRPQEAEMAAPAGPADGMNLE